MVYSNLHLGLGTDIRSSYPVLSFPAPPTPVSAASQLSGLSQPPFPLCLTGGAGGPGRPIPLGGERAGNLRLDMAQKT
jgi:hypothetical protein